MAEVVFQNLEQQLPVLEELSREGVFNEDELRAIIKRRTHFEYKLQKRITKKKDILDYLEYEMKLDALRQKRSVRLKLKPYNAAAVGITKKIHTLFRKGLMKFSDDLSLWMRYIDFCKTTNSVRALSLAFGKLLQQHGTNPQVWLMAAKHEIERMKSFENGRSIFQRALRLNKTSKELWHEYFRAELLHVDKIKKRKKILLEGGLELQNEEEPEPEQIEDFLANKTAQIVYRSAIQTITDTGDEGAEFRTKFVHICREFEDCDNLVDMIYESLASDFHLNPTVREELCLRPLVQLRRDTFIVKEPEWIRVEGEVKGNFESAVAEMKTAAMYEKYFNSFAKLMQESKTHEQMERRLNIVLEILQEAEDAECVTETMFVMWNELLVQIGSGDDGVKVLKRGLGIFPSSFPLWQGLLLAGMENGDEWESLRSQFKKCVESVEVAADRANIVKLYLEAAMEVSDEETAEVFEEMIAVGKEMKQLLLPQYLRWLQETKGLTAVRKFYGKHLRGSADRDFIQSCIDVESVQDTKDISKLRELHEKMITDHGETVVDVWLDYIRFEKVNAAEDFDVVGKIYMKAKRTLQGELVSDFVSAYTVQE